jgi:anti-sigma regulatory factor (Ser/Thr protein kinase)
LLASDTQGLCDMDTAADRLTLSIPSHPCYLCVLQGFFGSLLAGLSFSSAEGIQVTLAVHEACTNIMAHSYQGDTAQRIDLTVLITPEELAVEIRDYGRKPDLAAIQPRALHDVRPGGLGTHFMRSIMDTVTYDVSPDTGTLLRMTKRRSEPCTSP